jgi:hypothetical protein
MPRTFTLRKFFLEDLNVRGLSGAPTTTQTIPNLGIQTVHNLSAEQLIPACLRSQLPNPSESPIVAGRLFYVTDDVSGLWLEGPDGVVRPLNGVVIPSFTLANLLAQVPAGMAGRLARVTDVSPANSLYYDTGSAWISLVGSAISPSVFVLTNHAGVGVVAGDIVTIDPSHDSSVILGDTAGSYDPYLVSLDATANLGTGRFQMGGLATANVTGVITRGHFLRKSASTKALEDLGIAMAATTAWPNGAVGVALQSAAGPGSALIAVLLFGLTVTTTSGVLTTTGDLLTVDQSGNVVRHGIGANGTVPIADSTKAVGWDWGAIPGFSTLTTKGDLLTYDGSVLRRLGVGTAGQVLTVDPGQPYGIQWEGSPFSKQIISFSGVIWDSVGYGLYNATGTMQGTPLYQVYFPNCSQLPYAATIRNFRAGIIRSPADPSAVFSSGSVTLVKNGTPTALTVTGLTNGAPLGSDTSHAVTCAAGDQITIACTVTSGSPGGTQMIFSATAELDPI